MGILFSAFGNQLVSHYFPDILASVTSNDLVAFEAGYDQSAYSDGWSIALKEDLDLASESVPSDVVDKRAWLMQRGGADIDHTSLKLVFRGMSPVDVLITAARVDVKLREEPWTGASVDFPSAGQQDVIGMYFNLDEEHPVARHYDSETDEIGGAFFSGSFYSLAHREIMVFEITAVTEGCYCEWVLEFDIEQGDRKETITIDDSGQPFKTSAYMEDGYDRNWEWTWWDPPARFIEVDY